MKRNGKRKRRTSTRYTAHDGTRTARTTVQYKIQCRRIEEEKRRVISRKDEWNDYGKAERTKNEDTSRQAIRITRQTDKAKHADFIFLVSYLLLVGSYAAWA